MCVYNAHFANFSCSVDAGDTLNSSQSLSSHLDSDHFDYTIYWEFMLLSLLSNASSAAVAASACPALALNTNLSSAEYLLHISHQPSHAPYSYAPVNTRSCAVRVS